MQVLVSGSNGLLGAALVASLEADGHTAGRLVRTGESDPGRVLWSAETGVTPREALAKYDAVVHLAGKSLATLWTPAAKREIRESRVSGTRTIADAVAACQRPPVFVCASAVGFYGDRGDDVLTEESGGGAGFLADLCRDWEAAAEPARAAGARVVHLRSGIVLARTGGPLAKMLIPFRLGLGGRMGSGRQWMSWVTLADATRAIRFALEDDELDGPFNVTSPEPVTNAVFTKTLGAALRRPTAVPVPAFALRALPGGFGTETLLASQRAIPARLTERGFAFRQAQLEAALRSELGAGA